MANPLYMPRRRALFEEEDILAPNIASDPMSQDIYAPPARVEGPTRPTAEYKEPKMGKGRLIGGILASLFSPALGQHVLNSPYDRAERDYRNQRQAQTDFDYQANRGRQQTQDAFDAAKQGADIRRSDAMVDYYERPRRSEAAQTTTIGDKLMQWNPQTERYDIEAGAAPVKNDLSASPFERWSKENPDAPVANWLDLEARTDARHRKPDREPRAPRATPGQSAAIEARKNRELRKIESDFQWNQTTGQFAEVSGNAFSRRTLTPEQFQQRKQQIQDDYEAEINALGGTADPYEYPPLDDGEAKRLLDKATQAATDEGGVLDPDKATANFDTLKQREQQRKASGAAPKRGDTRSYRGQNYTFDGREWVLDQQK